MSKYGVIPGLYFPEFSPNTGKFGPEETSYLETFHATLNFRIFSEVISTYTTSTKQQPLRSVL